MLAHFSSIDVVKVLCMLWYMYRGLVSDGYLPRMERFLPGYVCFLLGKGNPQGQIKSNFKLNWFESIKILMCI